MKEVQEHCVNAAMGAVVPGSPPSGAGVGGVTALPEPSPSSLILCLTFPLLC